MGPGGETVLPGRAEAKLDFRLVPNMTRDEAAAKLKAHLEKRGFGDIEVIVSGGYSPTESPEDSVSRFGCGGDAEAAGSSTAFALAAQAARLAWFRATAQDGRAIFEWATAASARRRMAADRQQQPQGRRLRAAAG